MGMEDRFLFVCTRSNGPEHAGGNGGQVSVGVCTEQRARACWWEWRTGFCWCLHGATGQSMLVGMEDRFLLVSARSKGPEHAGGKGGQVSVGVWLEDVIRKQLQVRLLCSTSWEELRSKPCNGRVQSARPNRGRLIVTKFLASCVCCSFNQIFST